MDVPPRYAQQYPQASRVEVTQEERDMRYTVIIERGGNSFGAYVPDLPGCVAVGETKGEVLQLIREAIEFHLEGMKKQGLAIPEPKSISELVLKQARILM
jgi:predicted RNase H-like HicB family nuclease